MTREELEKEAEAALEKRLGTYAYIRKQDCYRNYVDGFQDGAEPREKRIAEQEELLNSTLEENKEIYKKMADLDTALEDCTESLTDARIKIKELEEKISILLSCKNCPENKGGYICEKEYEGKCLSQKTQYIKELQEENAKLKEQNNKAKELIRNIIRVTWGEGWNYDLEWKVKAEQFIKESK